MTLYRMDMSEEDLEEQISLLILDMSEEYLEEQISLLMDSFLVKAIKDALGVDISSSNRLVRAGVSAGIGMGFHMGASAMACGCPCSKCQHTNTGTEGVSSDVIEV